MSNTNNNTSETIIKRIEQVPIDELVCPITYERFNDPVIAGDGHIYERVAIIQWIRENGTSPLTREPLRLDDIRTDTLVHVAITRHYENKLCDLTTLLELQRRQARRRKRQQRARRIYPPSTNLELPTISATVQNLPLPTPVQPNNRLPPLRLNVPVRSQHFEQHRRQNRNCSNLCDPCKQCGKKCFSFCNCRQNAIPIIGISCFVIAGITILTVSLAVGLTRVRTPNFCHGKTGFLGQTTCSIDNDLYFKNYKELDTILTPARQYEFYLYIYQAKTDKNSLIFQFSSGGEWYLHDVSVIDTWTNRNVIENGGFEDGTLIDYCVCGSAWAINGSIGSVMNSSTYSCSISTLSATVNISQTINLIDGRFYAISFWLYNRDIQDRDVRVYMGTASTIDFHFSKWIVLQCILFRGYFIA